MYTFSDLTEDSITIIYNDTSLVKFDSSFHLLLYQDFLSDDFYSEPCRVYLELDRQTSYLLVQKLLDQLRKVGLLGVKFRVNRQDFIGFKSPPMSIEENTNLDSSIHLIPAPPPPPTPDSAVKNSSIVLISHRNGHVKLWLDNNEVADLKSLILENKDLIIIYGLDSSNTYDDFIQVIDLVFCSFNEVRKEIIHTDSLTMKEARSAYPLRMLSTQLLKNSYPNSNLAQYIDSLSNSN